MRATKFEFEHRFWIIMAIYLADFTLTGVDHTSFVVWLRHWIAPSVARGTSEAEVFARIVITIGALLVFATAAIRTWGAAYLRTDVVHDTAQHSEALVADGPFRYVRNLLYFANLPMATGIGVLASRSGFIFLVLANWIFVYRLIFREEKALRQTQGESYLAYCRSAPRFLAVTEVKGSFRKSEAAMGSGVRGGRLSSGCSVSLNWQSRLRSGPRSDTSCLASDSSRTSSSVAEFRTENRRRAKSESPATSLDDCDRR